MDLDTLSLTQLEVLSNRVHDELMSRYKLRVESMPKPLRLNGLEAILDYRREHGCSVMLAKLVVEHWRVKGLVS